MSLDDRFDNGEAESAAAGGFARGVDFIETIEDERQMLRRNARTCIAYPQPDAL